MEEPRHVGSDAHSEFLILNCLRGWLAQFKIRNERQSGSVVLLLLLTLLLSVGPARAAPILEVLNTATVEFIDPPGVTNQISYGPVRTLVQLLPPNSPP